VLFLFMKHFKKCNNKHLDGSKISGNTDTQPERRIEQIEPFLTRDSEEAQN
jgi:hypothetical protein